MIDQTTVEKDGIGRFSKLSYVSFIIGLISLALPFVFIFGVMAVVCGYKARRGLHARSAIGIRSTMAFVGMMFGLLSFISGGLMVSGAHLASTGTTRKMMAIQAVASLESAITGFQVEYGSMPAGESRMATDSAAGVYLLRVLMGEENSSGIRNSKSIRFLFIKEGKNRKHGLIRDENGKVEGLFDPFGNPYTVFLDADGDGAVEYETGGKVTRLTDRHAAVVSPGEDGKLGTSDDIKSW